MPQLPSALAWFAAHRLRLVTGFVHPVPVGRCRFHRHDHIELVLHRSGHGTSRVASGAELPFTAGQATLYPAGALHDQDNRASGEDLCLHLDAGARSPVVLGQASVLAVTLAQAGELAALATAAPDRDAPAGRLALDLRATAVALGLLAAATGDAVVVSGAGRAGLAARYLAEHLTTVGRLSEVARYVGLSEDRLRHVFTAEHGVGPLAYLSRLRCEHACTLLRRTDLPLAAVARACGFATARYLCAVFRRRYGCPPGEWRLRV